MQRMRKANALMPESTLRTGGKRMRLTRQAQDALGESWHELLENASGVQGKRSEPGGKAGMAFAAFADLRPWG